MNLAALMTRAAQSRPDNPAILIGTTVHSTYAALGERVARIAGWLRGPAGLQPGDRVGFAMTNCPEFVEVLWACWHAGLVAVPINAKLHVSDFRYIFTNSGARLGFATPDLADDLNGLLPELPDCGAMLTVGSDAYQAILSADPLPMEPRAAEDLAWLFYTSGTTGKPKGAMLSHRNLLACLQAYLSDIDQVEEDYHWLHAAPMSHGGGLYSLPFVAKAAAQVIPESGKFDPAEIMDMLRTTTNLCFFAAPTMVKRLLESPAVRKGDTSNLRTIVYGGAPMYVADAKEALALFGPKLAQLYGQGESPMTITALGRHEFQRTDAPGFEERLASVGRAFTNTEVAIMDGQDTPLPPGELGEVCVRGEPVMAGYWGNPEASAETLRNGWLHTGDVGVLDAAGYLTLKDRSKDMIISGGTNIYPREVEEVMLLHPGVLEVSVVGEPDPEWGENVVAFVVPRQGAGLDEKDLDRFCLDNMARFKRPKSYHFIDALPKNNYGKVLKTELRERLAAL
jgi:long-chain acyl-CoA synthetase